MEQIILHNPQKEPTNPINTLIFGFYPAELKKKIPVV